jgi:prepilin-type N-terminal cleavage/methylation domain-containing protein
MPATRPDLARPAEVTSLHPPAFTLLEVVAVIALVAVLAGIALGSIQGTLQRTGIARARVELSALARALEEYKRRHGDYPQSQPGPGLTTPEGGGSELETGDGSAVLFAALTGWPGRSGPIGAPGRGPALIDSSKFTQQATSPAGTTPAASAFIDPWGNRYRYHYPGAARTFPGVQPALSAPGPAYVLFSVGPDGVIAGSGPGADPHPTKRGHTRGSDDLFAHDVP